MTTTEAQTQGHPPATVLRCHELRCERDGRLLFDSLALTLQPGEACELLGSNGSGKSTLLRCIAGLYPEYEGEIDCQSSVYFGHRLALNGLLSVAENLAWYAALHGVEAVAENKAMQVEALLQQVGLSGYAPVPVAQLSAGQQRRVALARLLLAPVGLWLLDEPYTALDTAGQGLVDGLIERHLAAGGALLCATHQALGISHKSTLTLGPSR